VSLNTLIFEVRDGVGTITLNRPESMNAANDEMYRELAEVITEVGATPEIGCAIITGAGRAFCVGADVKAMKPDMPMLARRRRHRWILSTVVRPLINLEKPVIAAVNGHAVGAGLSIALAADIIVASERAMFSAIFAKMGLVPDLGSLYSLTRVVGLNKAKELCFTAKKIDAHEALSLGFVNRVVGADDLLASATALAVEIAAGPPAALAMMKALLNQSSNSTLEQMLELEGNAQTVAYSTSEYREGVASFKEKRAADFRRTQAS
jgi:2-(1,2-epoxy-1,2-dihydrophenyl)acetyl-CoA isomerase